jgi:hypothetical protein
MIADAISLHDRLPDWGPRYVETPPEYPPSQLIAEPWNAASALLFIGIVIFWLIRLRGRYTQFPFLCICLPLLLVGGIGGTLFHALRTQPAFFLMDVIPIYLLGLSASIYLWFRLRPRLLYLVGLIALLCFLQALGLSALPTQWAINVSYATLAALVITPLALVLIRTRFRHGGWVTTAFVLFGMAWVCRIAETWRPTLPMGTHWLWHAFGALSTLALSEYFFRIEGEGHESRAPTDSSQRSRA